MELHNRRDCELEGADFGSLLTKGSRHGNGLEVALPTLPSKDKTREGRLEVLNAARVTIVWFTFCTIFQESFEAMKLSPTFRDPQLLKAPLPSYRRGPGPSHHVESSWWNVRGAREND